MTARSRISRIARPAVLVLTATLALALATAASSAAGALIADGPTDQAVRVNIHVVNSLSAGPGRERSPLGAAKTDDPPLFGSEISLDTAAATSGSSNTDCH